MKLKPVGSNQTEVEITRPNGDLTVFFSYQTPVAAHVAGEGFKRTSEKYSKTTTRHINAWLAANGATPEKVVTVPPSWFAGVLTATPTLAGRAE